MSSDPPTANGASVATPSAPATANGSNEGDLRFPPFPPVPDGATIVPFIQFRASGIQVTCIPLPENGGAEDDIERDALGVPTVELAKYHDTDAPKTDARKRRVAKAPHRFHFGSGGGKGKKGKSKGSAAVVDQNGNAVPWYEEWEAGEQFQHTSAGQDLAPDDRLLQAAEDFLRTRRWPDDGTFKTAYIWDQFRYFTGLLDRDNRLNKKMRSGSPDSDFDMDDDDDDEFGAGGDIPMVDAAPDAHQSLARFDENGRPLPRVPYDAMDALAEAGAVESNVIARKRRALEDREARLYRFIEAPDEAVTVFMSSYMREKGLIYYMNLLTNTPKVLAAFVRFLHRNRVFPEPSSMKALERALAVCSRAEDELPLTDRAAKALPDALGGVLRDCWGRKREVVYGGQLDEAEEEEHARREREERERAQAQAMEEVRAHERATVERIAKRQREEAKAAGAIADGGGQSSGMLHIDGQAAVGIGWGDAWDSGADVDANANAGWGGGWGDTWGSSSAAAEGDAAADPISNGWGGTWGSDIPATVPGAEGPVDDASVTAPIPDADGGAGAVGIEWDQPVVDDWTAPDELNTLFHLLGPTALPLTHTTGIVEYSTRRIVSLHPPVIPAGASPQAAAAAASSTANEDGQDASAPTPGLAPALTQAERAPGTSRRELCGADDPDRVEDALDTTFGKIVLEPWPHALGGDIREPSIKPSSRGPVVLPAHQRALSAANLKMLDASPSAGAVAGAEGTGAPANTNKKPHDPYTSRIALLVEPPVLETLRVGMGIAAVFVQIARQEDVLGTGAPPKPEGEKKKKKKKKSGANAGPPAGSYWYLEDNIGILPGYYLNDGEEE
ncbi:hypothetical protein CONPUDRAFT_84977 [Coniophora puteana RWD-64-598 SS2]|uniref:Uncharacterized protein n=1 Tax=Coniophora puteana (strain RWD-64-598) TaxID=741705 RepID=A0A5M3MAZ6_CONPW|nr:uncharacterized protein CONPUDRAFT_84977 [Coniophora puteana RWD-64-598 SS2]EIW76399.1 hypothetical protein CONPUDRAFT_84977 [Coniophora puteana RWD-64-598 SS2]